jgi:hypothetical protein
MTPSDLLTAIRADGGDLTMSPTGSLRIIHPDDHDLDDTLRAAIGPLKDALLGLLREEAARTVGDEPPPKDPAGGTTPGPSGAAGLHERSGADLMAAEMSLDALPRLPLFGRETHYVRGWSHMMCGYPKCGKTDLLADNVREWNALGETVCYITEEPEATWQLRVHVMGGDWSRTQFVFGLGADPQALLTRALSGRESIIVLDTARNLLGLEDERDNSEVARAPAIHGARARAKGKTLIVSHHMRKGGGPHGEGIAGAAAFLGVFDVAFELAHDEHQDRRRIIRGLARVIAIPDLLYERAEDGALRALGDPAELALAEVKRRIVDILDSEQRTTAEITAALGDPRPSEEQVRQALLELARAGAIHRDPPMSEGVKKGKAYRWHAHPGPGGEASRGVGH